MSHAGSVSVYMCAHTEIYVLWRMSLKAVTAKILKELCMKVSIGDCVRVSRQLTLSTSEDNQY